MNARDKDGLVHRVRERPDDLKMGRTVCFKFFTFPLYTSATGRRACFDGTDDMVTCLACVVCL